jgi:hypothetical protein
VAVGCDVDGVDLQRQQVRLARAIRPSGSVLSGVVRPSGSLTACRVPEVADATRRLLAEAAQ